MFKKLKSLNITVSNKDDIIKYFKKHPDIKPICLDVLEDTRKSFIDKDIHLKVYSDSCTTILSISVKVLRKTTKIEESLDDIFDKHIHKFNKRSDIFILIAEGK